MVNTSNVDLRSYICCTVRTAELYDRFKSGIVSLGLCTIEHFLEKKDVWYYNKYADIVVLEIWKESFVFNKHLILTTPFSSS